MPVEVPDLALEAFVPEHVIAVHLGFGNELGVVGDAEEAEADQHRVELVPLPVAGEMLELRVEVIEGVISGVELLDVFGGIELLDIFGVGQDQVEGAGRGLRDQPQHVVPAGVVLGPDLDPVLALEISDDVRLGVSGPCEDDQFFFRSGKASQGQQTGQRRGACQDAGGLEECTA